jgi:hypothetical protein
MTHDEVAALLGAYALDAVEPEEAVLVAAHVEECPRCAAELAEHLEVAGMLGDLGAGEAPKELWHAIASQAIAPTTGAPAVVRRRARRTLRATRAPRPGRRARATAAAVLVGALAVALVVMALQIASLNHTVNRLSALSQQRGISQAAEAALLDPSARRISLRTSTGVVAAELVLVADGRSFLFNAKMASLPSTETYQLWSTSDGRAISLGLLGSRPNAVPFVSGGTATTFAVTVEPAGGTEAPTHPPVAESA